MRKVFGSLTIALLSATASPAISAQAQTGDVVIMRRVLAAPATPRPVETQVPAIWTTGEWTHLPACSGTAEENRTVACVRGGSPQPDAACTQPRPDARRSVADYSACTFAWTVGEWGAPSSTCSIAATEMRDVGCVRQDGNPADDASCADDRPASSRTLEVTTSCSYAWDVGDWSSYSSTCSPAATRTRTVSCRRSDITMADDALCSRTAPRPAGGDTAAVTSGCVHAWSYGSWISDSTCSSATTQRRSATCMRTIGGTDVAVDAASCAGIAKDDVRTGVADDTSCPTQWRLATWNPAPPATACTSAFAQTTTATCQTSYPDGTANGVADERCNQADRPPTSRTIAATTGCSYAWEIGDWSSYSSSCSSTAHRDRTVSCRRSDGTTVSDAQCGTPPATSETAAVTSGCAVAWRYGAWVSDSTCSKSTTQRRTTTCMRTIDGAEVAVDASACAGIAKTDVQTNMVDNSTCATAWTRGAWTPTPPSNTCTSQYAQTATVTCQAKYPDASVINVADTRCSQATRPASSQSVAVTTGCTYTPSYGAYGACDASGVKTATISSCVRSDNLNVANSFCSPQTKTASCYTCSLTQKRSASFGSSVGNYASTVAAASSACQGRAFAAGRGGTCYWDGSIASFGAEYPTLTTGTATEYAGYCSVTP